ncbi:MAG: DUF6514 family protein [Eubacteriales bacterium]
MSEILKYSMQESVIISDEKGRCYSHGIHLLTYGDNGVLKDIDTIRDISICRGYVETIVQLLEKNKVSPIHFHEVIEDIIGVY